MTKEEIKIMSESMVGFGKTATASSLDFVKKGFEAFKTIEIPIIAPNGDCASIKAPYRDNEGVRNLVDFMIIFLDEAIKDIDKQIKEDEAK